MPSPLHTCFAICTPGIESILEAELRADGIAPGRAEPGGVEFAATTEQLYLANLSLRTASRVVVRIAEFHARTFFELERHAGKVEWGAWVPPASAVEFHVTSRKSKLYHQKAIAERLEQAVGRSGGQPDRRTDGHTDGRTGQRILAGSPRSPTSPTSPTALFVVRLVRDQVTISADSSGELLHRRGYRLAAGKAPLRETLAAAMVLASGWDRVAPLIDPFAGSGTIPIEAALLARRIAPGLNRAFAFQHWPTFDEATWARLLTGAREAVLPAAAGLIAGSDRDAGAIEAARANAIRAGVAADIRFQRATVSELDAKGSSPGWIVTNPPYGVRVGEAARLRDLYARLGQVLGVRFPGWRLGLLSGDRRLEVALSLDLTERFATENGGLPVRFLSGSIPMR